MYGIVNQGILSFLQARLGQEAAERVHREAGVTAEFLGMRQYPDEESSKLVVAAAEELGSDVAQVLEEIGEHWVAFALDGPYADHLHMAGSTFQETLESLDDVHVRLSHDFAEYEPPSFRVEPVCDGVLRLFYRSTREGLAPLAKGIVRGIATMFGESIEIEVLESPSASEAVFELSGFLNHAASKAS